MSSWFLKIDAGSTLGGLCWSHQQGSVCNQSLNDILREVHNIGGIRSNFLCMIYDANVITITGNEFKYKFLCAKCQLFHYKARDHARSCRKYLFRMVIILLVKYVCVCIFRIYVYIKWLLIFLTKRRQHVK